MKRWMVIVGALALAVVAGWLWLGGAGAPMSHGEIDAADRDALRDTLREDLGR